MRVIKGLFLFCFLSVGISACFDAPEFDVTPEITFDKVQFKEVEGVATNDSLILYLHFRDGDGDLGVYQDDLEEPFNAAYYFIADGTGDTTKLATTQVYDTDEKPYQLLKTEGNPGKLVTNRTRNQPGYSYLPIYDNTCAHYADAELLVPASAADNTYNIVDTLHDQGGNAYYLIQGELLLYKANPNHNNIDVRFWVYNNGNYVEFDWIKEYCISFNGRFPVLADKPGPLEGTLRYAMPSTGFIPEFSIKQLKLSAKIRDRSLHVSDSVLTPNFTLDGIRVN